MVKNMASPLGILLKLRVDSDPMGRSPSIDDQARYILDTALAINGQTHQPVGITFSTDQAQSDRIKVEYKKPTDQQTKIEIKGDSNQEQVMRRVEELLWPAAPNKYQGLQHAFQVLPISTCARDAKGGVKEVDDKVIAQETDSIKQMLMKADGVTVLGWQNQDFNDHTERHFAIGGGSDDKLTPAQHQTIEKQFELWMQSYRWASILPAISLRGNNDGFHLLVPAILNHLKPPADLKSQGLRDGYNFLLETFAQYYGLDKSKLELDDNFYKLLTDTLKHNPLVQQMVLGPVLREFAQRRDPTINGTAQLMLAQVESSVGQHLGIKLYSQDGKDISPSIHEQKSTIKHWVVDSAAHPVRYQLPKPIDHAQPQPFNEREELRKVFGDEALAREIDEIDPAKGQAGDPARLQHLLRAAVQRVVDPGLVSIAESLPKHDRLAQDAKAVATGLTGEEQTAMTELLDDIKKLEDEVNDAPTPHKVDDLLKKKKEVLGNIHEASKHVTVTPAQPAPHLTTTAAVTTRADSEYYVQRWAQKTQNKVTDLKLQGSPDTKTKLETLAHSIDKRAQIDEKQVGGETVYTITWFAKDQTQHAEFVDKFQETLKQKDWVKPGAQRDISKEVKEAIVDELVYGSPRSPGGRGG